MLVLIVAMMLVSASFWLLFVYTLDQPVIRGSVARSQQTVSRICGALFVFLGIRVASMSR
jgi:threonine/homoserine/homoserine lactone efflux protein